ncbi:nuclear envelope phosphatase-regulatory subunit 1 homolog [Drosophila sechellia]|uniref:Transmembrane protein 188 n=1 Tax=Drosophila sechellia TaxID=7238 RepID=B4IKP2_DROSE|nr:nuclear envelope phosphatase-regulatory subunit 1 homolog [Drosophila sechellia]EDW51656.1 GM10063 [Drosophila sechellia]
MDHTDQEDLLAFERRLAEVVNTEKRSSFRWRFVLGAIFACSAISACHWVRDAKESESVVFKILSSHSAFAFSLATICLLVLYGVDHAAKQDPSILRDTREMLSPFRLNIDNQGRLILVPPQTE